MSSVIVPIKFLAAVWMLALGRFSHPCSFSDTLTAMIANSRLSTFSSCKISSSMGYSFFLGFSLLSKLGVSPFSVNPAVLKAAPTPRHSIVRGPRQTSPWLLGWFGWNPVPNTVAAFNLATHTSLGVGSSGILPTPNLWERRFWYE